MKWSDIATLLSLAAMWGGSYLFMRLGAGEFGALPLAGLRAAGAALLLLPLLAWQGGLGPLRTHWRGIAVVGVANFALPFVLFSWAALQLPAGSSALFTGATPLFGAAIAWIWLREKLSPSRMAGLAIGFAGILFLVWDSLGGVARGNPLAPCACLLATILYGFSGNYTKRYLDGVPPLAIAAGSQGAAALLLAVPTAVAWPATMPGMTAWIALGLLALLCSALAYVLFFGLIARVGASRTLAVTFMIPAFGVLWGVLFLDERLTLAMAGGCAIILAGTGLATGLAERKGAPKLPIMSSYPTSRAGTCSTTKSP